MPIPYRASTFRQPVHQAPPVPTTPEELQALMLLEFGPRPPRPPEEQPMGAILPRSCRFHPRVWSQAAVFRGPLGNDEGWVLLCGACAAALQGGTLRVLDTCGRYQGRIPAPTAAGHPLSR